MTTPQQIFLPVSFNKTFDDNGNYYVITGEVTSQISKSPPAIYVERMDDKYVFSKEELEDELYRMVQYIGSRFETDLTIKIKRHAREYLNQIL